MSTKLTEAQYHLLEQIADQNGFTDHELKEYSTSSKGDNYLGQMVCVTIEKNDEKLELINKTAPANVKFRTSLPVRELFLKEIYLYETVLQTFTDFQKECGLNNPFRAFPKFYGKCEEEYNECLVLENLVKNDFSHWNRKLPMNSDHVAVVMAEYGKFHAVSYAMKVKNPELFDSISEILKVELTDWEKESSKAFLNNTCKTLQKAIEGNCVLENAYERLTANVYNYFLEVMREPKEKMVITHGDCWCNNMLFKYEDPNDAERPTKVCLIDWQLSRYGLPVLDITYFFCASSPKEILNDYEKYLKIYHNSLSENLRNMSCNPEEFLSFEELKSLWKKSARYGLLLGGFIFKVLYVDSQDAPEVSKNTTSMKDFYDQFDVAGTEEKIKERIVDLFNYVIDNDFV